MLSIVELASSQSDQKTSQRINRLWQQLQELRAGNDELQQQLSTVHALYCQTVLPHEREQLLPALEELIDRLIRFFGRKTLPHWAREELVMWLHQLIDRVMRLDSKLGDELARQFNEAVAKANGLSPDELEQEQQAEYEAQQQGEALGSVLGDFFQEMNDAGNEGDFHQAFKRFAENMRSELGVEGEAEQLDFDDWLSSIHDDFLEKWHASQSDENASHSEHSQNKRSQNKRSQNKQSTDEPQAGQSEPTDGLDVESWLKTAFRRLARALHPDREPDAELREHKQQQLARLTAARDEQDMVALLEVYLRTVEQYQLDVDTLDHRQLEKLLNEQVHTLKQQRHTILEASPELADIYHRLYHPTEAGRAEYLEQELAHIEAQAESSRALNDYLRNINCLKDVLRQRLELL